MISECSFVYVKSLAKGTYYRPASIMSCASNIFIPLYWAKVENGPENDDGPKLPLVVGQHSLLLWVLCGQQSPVTLGEIN